MPARLRIIFIDVGKGDSIFLHASDANDAHEFALIDCNDTTNCQSSRVFLKRYFDRNGFNPVSFPAFKYVFATHAHSDHINGIQRVLRSFGTETLYSSVCNRATSLALVNLQRWATTATSSHRRVANAVDDLWRNKVMSLPFGPATISPLWPPDCGAIPFDPRNENNNSLVLALKLKNVELVLTGDCEAGNFDTSKVDHVQLPRGLQLIQSPHHGARNGGFDAAGAAPFFDQLESVTTAAGLPAPKVAISCHPRPHGHPHPSIPAEFDARRIREIYQTDEHYHLIFETEGTRVEVQYTH